MTQEEKQLLLKDLCGRLPYGVIVSIGNGKYREDKKLWSGLFDDDGLWGAKPYLRPIDSITKEEEKEWEQLLNYNLSDENEMLVTVFVEDTPDYIDWFNAHHFDYRDLIEKGLALEAPEGMYKTE